MIISVDSQWSFIEVQYLATTRDNFYTGFFIPDSNLYMDIGKSDTE